MDQQTSSRTIIDRFGGVAKMAKALQHPNMTTVQYWLSRGYIPGHRHQEIWDAAQRLGIEIHKEEFAAVVCEKTNNGG